MRKLVTKEVSFCDVCRREQYLSRRCKTCGAEMCGHCWETHGTTYPSNVYFSNGNDGYYCNLCDEKLRSEGGDPLHSAFLKVQELRLESERWSKDFEARVKTTENTVRVLALAQDEIPSPAEPKGITVVRRNGVIAAGVP